MPRSSSPLLVLAVSLLTLTASAQKHTGTITGTVMDSSGAVVAGANVTVIDTATNFSRSMVTNDQGQFTTTDLNPSLYSVKATKSGFKETLQKDVEVHVGEVRDIRIKLEL